MTSRAHDAILEETLQVEAEMATEEVWWDHALAMVQTGPDQVEPVYHVVVSISSPQVGHKITSMATLPLAEAMDEGQVRSIFRQCLEGLRAARSQVLAQQGGQTLQGQVVPTPEEILATINGSS